MKLPLGTPIFIQNVNFLLIRNLSPIDNFHWIGEKWIASNDEKALFDYVMLQLALKKMYGYKIFAFFFLEISFIDSSRKIWQRLTKK